MTKVCRVCKIEKPLSEFYKRSRNNDGLASWCIECINRGKYEYRVALPNNKFTPEFIASIELQPPENPLDKRAVHIKHKYGLSSADYDALLASQNYKCAICGTNRAESKHGFFHVDHDHETNKTRGLLCRSCNIAIGMLHDDVALLEAAIAYLRAYSG